ncbi:MAG: putative DNA binding domain-containing protein [Azoarcus sp.]|jgi:ATP-dependent DNA helicase RecG|nr:putative DNA binding domain-containing protein [Azoarcus sp.]
MEPAQLNTVLEQLIATWENEVVEFKRAGDGFSTDEIGRYFCALANEANLRGAESGWLVFGVDNKSRRVIGTDYRPQAERLQSLKMQIAENTEPRITFRDIHELHHADGRVLLMAIPAAPRGIPIAWKGHYYARAGESLISLGLDKLDEIRLQTLAQDWTAQVVPGATFDDLDGEAVNKAREDFARKYANRLTLDEVKNWPLATFLDRARLTQNGRITRTTLLLLGKRESAWRLSPHPAQLTWSLEGQERAYEHFSLPFLTSTTALYQRIRNIQLRILPPDELVALEIPKYDRKIVLEALHNCIAHQDYTDHGRIVVIEQLDKLIFQNVGGFFEGQPGDYIDGAKVPSRYRNPFLAQAMSELNMIDTMGFGIRDMYRGQMRRYFPLPDYDLSERGMTKMTIYGGVIDMAYSGLLIQKTDLSLADVLALDRVQKKLPIPDDTAAHLRKARLIEGRKPRYFVSASVAKATASVADYIRTRGQDDAFYAKLITDFLGIKGEATRAEINQLLWSKLSDALSDEQKDNKVANLLTNLRRQGLICNTGGRKHPMWRLAE